MLGKCTFKTHLKKHFIIKLENVCAELLKYIYIQKTHTHIFKYTNYIQLLDGCAVNKKRHQVIKFLYQTRCAWRAVLWIRNVTYI